MGLDRSAQARSRPVRWRDAPDPQLVHSSRIFDGRTRFIVGIVGARLLFAAAIRYSRLSNFAGKVAV